MYQKILALSLVALALGACSDDTAETAKSELACNQPAVVQSVRNNLQEILKQEARAFARNDSRQFVDADKIIAAGTQLDIALDNPHTVQEGGKTLCSASLSIRIPTEIAAAAETNSPLIYGDTPIGDLIEQKVMGSNLSYADGRFSTTLRYLPDSDGIRFEDNTVTTLAQTTSAALLPYGVKGIVVIDGQAVSKEEALRRQNGEAFAEPPQADPQDILDNNAASQFEGIPRDEFDGHTEVLSPDHRPESPELGQSDLDDAREKNRAAENEINRIWDGMDRSVQKGLLGEQRAWIQQKTRNCMQAAVSADNQAAAEYLQLQCDTRMTRERSQYLKGYTIN